MSTLDATCGKCARQFRVRKEFFGKRARCPGCSDWLVVGSGAAPPAPSPVREQEPEPKPRRRPDDEFRSEQRTSDFKAYRSVDLALAREQTVLWIIIAEIIIGMLAACISQAATIQGTEYFALVIILALVLIPAFFAGMMAIMARTTALRSPPEVSGKSTIIPSLLFVGLALVGTLGLGYTLLESLTESRRNEDAFYKIGLAVVVMIFLSSVSFAMYACQVAMARGSRDAAASLGWMTIGTACAMVFLVVAGIGLFFVSDILAPKRTYYSNYNGMTYATSYRDDGPIYAVFFGLFVPVILIVGLLMYQRFLAAVRRSLRTVF